MIYLEQFQFPTKDQEFDFFLSQKRTCYDSFYPFNLLSNKDFRWLHFEPITILCGSNGCGKTTALNIISETLFLPRDTLFNRSNFWDTYIALCKYSLENPLPKHSKTIVSDDVFDYMLNIRNMNQGIDHKREDLFEDYLDTKYAQFTLQSIDDYEALKKVNLARKKTQSKYVRNRLMDNVRELSNGESAFFYFTQKMAEEGLYILDEPENSLSPEKQLELVQFIEDSVRFFNCQFIISTHSPFFLSLKGAKIYDLDENPVSLKKWTDIESVKAYYHFFKNHEKAFEEK